MSHHAPSCPVMLWADYLGTFAEMGWVGSMHCNHCAKFPGSPDVASSAFEEFNITAAFFVWLIGHKPWLQQKNSSKWYRRWFSPLARWSKSRKSSSLLGYDHWRHMVLRNSQLGGYIVQVQEVADLVVSSILHPVPFRIGLGGAVLPLLGGFVMLIQPFPFAALKRLTVTFPVTVL